MKTTASFLAACATVSATALLPFTIDTLPTHMPNGVPSGQVNYYRIDAAVNSTNSGEPRSAWCGKFWGDNGWTNEQAYSVYVPAGEWLPCDTAQGTYDYASPHFSFKLFPYFSIGNFSVAIKEDLGDGKIVYSLNHITNQTDSYTCQMNPYQSAPYTSGVHASGDCSIPDGKAPFKFEVSSEDPTA